MNQHRRDGPKRDLTWPSLWAPPSVPGLEPSLPGWELDVHLIVFGLGLSSPGERRLHELGGSVLP